MKLVVLVLCVALQLALGASMSAAQTATPAPTSGQSSGQSSGSTSPTAPAQPQVQVLMAPKTEGPPQFYNVRTSPLGILIGYLNIDFDFKVSDNWTVGPTFSYWSFDFDSSFYQNGKIKTTLTNVGVRGTYAPKGAFKNGIYFSPMFQYRSAKAEGTTTLGEKVTGSASLPVVTGIVGYQHWLGENFNFNAGLGLAVAPTTKIEVRDSTSTTSVETSQNGALALDLMIGYSF